ncbi:JAB domain-containing protein [Candidatus Mesenet endosymbiont of Phosphuga atrata]|uniref:JAB domain-containing protein n=1 Tax=Candidatus Mesenet endosymbiont of Phosphuga atrata TaxID=3066221 RepID=UPI003977DC7B
MSHNHLSSNVRPSQNDIDITKKLSLACHYMEIEFLDHVIVAPKRYFSFKEKGLL